MIERVVDARLSKIELHDALHGFRAKRGCGTGIMEAKLEAGPAAGLPRAMPFIWNLSGSQKGLRCHGQREILGYSTGLGGGAQDH